MKQTYRMLFLIFLLNSYSALSDDYYCNDKGRCINQLTNNAFNFKFSSTPVYKSTYSLDLIQFDGECNEVSAEVTNLPADSFFKETTDFKSQTNDEMIVHVYEVDILDSGADATIAKFFKTPFKLCKSGKNKVAKSLYDRRGGFDTGLLVIPFKLRDGDIFSDSTIGPYLSYKT